MVLRDRAEKPHFRRYFAILVGVIKTDPAQRDRYTWKKQTGGTKGKNTELSIEYFYDLCEARDSACTIIASWKNSAFFSLKFVTDAKNTHSLLLSGVCVIQIHIYEHDSM